MFFAKDGEVLPVDLRTMGAGGDALNFEDGLEGFEFRGGDVADFIGRWEFIQQRSFQAETGDADAVFVAEGAEGFDESLVVHGLRDEKLAVVRPARGADGLEEIGAAILEGDPELELGTR